MTKTKTLKDLEGNVVWDRSGNFIESNILKLETIKWIKEDRGLQKDNTIYRLSKDELFDLIEDRWMERLNIFEEDLE